MKVAVQSKDHLVLMKNILLLNIQCVILHLKIKIHKFLVILIVHQDIHQMYQEMFLRHRENINKSISYGLVQIEKIFKN